VKQFGGNALSAEVFPPAAQDYLADASDDTGDVARRYGTFKSVKKVSQRPEKAYQVIDLTAEFDRSRAAFSVFFDGAGRIAGVNIQPAAP